jgi:hypothetical protein
VSGQHHASAALPPGKTRYPLYRRLGGPQGRYGRVRKISPPPGLDPRTFQPVASRYTDWAIPAPACKYVLIKILKQSIHYKEILLSTVRLPYTVRVKRVCGFSQRWSRHLRLFEGMTPHHLIVGYPHFKITYWFRLQCSWTFRLLSLRQLCCLEKSGSVKQWHGVIFQETETLLIVSFYEKHLCERAHAHRFPTGRRTPLIVLP